ncbi:facilitated trehalose transporter Tret1-like [Macrobrachium nipponense]|uniref:facilitated trehalose transporter Tret1-like n=1 Tax=Macrobrachium nipponense TaxID=159736 RepID=UPI0030C8091D
MFSLLSSPRARQILASVTVGLLLSAMMATWGYPAAALPQWESEDSVIHLTTDQESWFATVTLMMCIPGSLIGASIYEWLGPRKTMLALAPTLGLFFMTMAVASWEIVREAGMAETVLLTSRVIQSIIVALLNPFVSVYTYEICDQSIRGMMTSFVEIWATIGYLLSYLAGCFLSWDLIALLLPIVLLVPAFTGLLISPESPLWLARINRENEATEILERIRSTGKEVMADLEAVRSTQSGKASTCSASLSIFTKRSHLKAIIASSLIFTVNQLGGFAIIAIYVVHIFNDSGVGLSPSWSSVVIGVFRLVFSVIASFLLRGQSRRRMLFAGNTLAAFASALMGTFFYLQSLGQDVSWLSWLPLFGLALYMVGYAGAVGPTTWTAGVEVLPGPVRSAGFGIATTCYSITAFTLSKFFLDMKDTIGLHGVFWFFSCGSLVYNIIVFFYIPETYGKSMKEVAAYWENTRTQETDKNATV